jgi:3-deoxy-manno-octulosonate cytidylyltransferase (CMP-KDO synthetase)
LVDEPEASMSTVVHAADPRAFTDENRVLAALDGNGFAMSFSRGRVSATSGSELCWQHVGLYAYRREFLLDFVTLARGTRELTEDLEQLRALEHGHRIRCAIVDGWRSAPVDVPADIAAVEARLRESTPC